MKLNRLLTLGFGLLTLAGAAAAAPAPEEKPAMMLEPFPLPQVRLLDSPWKAAQDRNQAYLLQLDPERLLHIFRVNAGLPAPGEPYTRWEGADSEVRGHIAGHYLSALALMTASTGDARLKERGALMVAELAKCQQALGGGYLSAYPESFLDRVDQGQPVWAPYYTLHKIMAGLYDQYAVCGNAQALEVLKGMAGYLEKRLERYPTPAALREVFDKYEEGGIAETLWNLYGVTGDPATRALADKLEKRSFLDPLARGEDNLAGRHGNTHIPLAVGAARRYELTGERRYQYAVEHFWDCVVGARAFATGGSTNGEVWGEAHRIASHGFSTTNHETCKTYNMLRVTRHLIEWTARPAYGDYTERALFNGILGTEGPEPGQLEYYVPQAAGYQRVFGEPFDAFWCCYGTGIESFAKLGDSIYFHDETGLYVNLFIPSTIEWPARGLTLRQETAFPEEPRTTLTVRVAAKGEAAPVALYLRVPEWADQGVKVKINDAPVDVATHPTMWLKLERGWKNGDRVELELPMRLRARPLPDDPNLVAFQYGPVVLAGVTDPGTGARPLLSWDANVPQAEAEKLKKAWFFLADTPDEIAWLKPVEGQPLTFRAEGQPFDMTFKPFNRIVGERYALYFPVVPRGSERHQALVKENAALDFLRAAESTSPTLEALRAAYEPLRTEPTLAAYQTRLTLALARACKAAGRDAEATELARPLTEPFVLRPDAAAVFALIGPPAAVFKDVKPLLVTGEGWDGSHRVVEREGRRGVATDVARQKRFVYFALPAGSILRGLDQTVQMSVDCYSEGGAGRKVMLEYDAADHGQGGNIPYSGVAAELPGPGWQRLTFECPSARLSGRQNLGADFRLAADTGDLVIGDVRLTASEEAIRHFEQVFAPVPGEVDRVRPNDAASEKAHNLQGEKTASASHLGQGWRHAETWWSWDLKTPAAGPATLACIYWGPDVGRVFDILVDGQAIATVHLDGARPGFVKETYPIPPALTAGHETVTVTFRKREGFAGGVFGCSLTAGVKD